jgi:hydroxyacylglutathione hydrolase
VATDDRTAVVVDPAESDAVMAAVKRLGVVPALALVTHHHRDHTAGCADLRRLTGCRVLGPRDGESGCVDRVVAGGDWVAAAGTQAHVIGVPGHTRNHVAYHFPAERILFTGDTLFLGGCGRVFDGRSVDLWHSLRALRDLPDDTRVYPGHDYAIDNLEFAASLDPKDDDVRMRLERLRRDREAGRPLVPSTMLEEKRTNPFLRVDDPAFQRAVRMPHTDPVSVFTALREKKDEW